LIEARLERGRRFANVASRKARKERLAGYISVAKPINNAPS